MDAARAALNLALPPPPFPSGDKDVDMGHCPSHDMMQQFFGATVERLGDEIKNLADALTQQSKANGAAIDKVLSNQADRRELCGAQNARLDNIERAWEISAATTAKQFAELWSVVNDQREKHSDLKAKVYQYIGVGTGLGIMVSLAAQLIIKAISH